MVCARQLGGSVALLSQLHPPSLGLNAGSFRDSVNLRGTRNTVVGCAQCSSKLGRPAMTRGGVGLELRPDSLIAEHVTSVEATLNDKNQK